MEEITVKLLANHESARCIRLEKEAPAIFQFSPTSKTLPGIQAGQIASLLSEGSKGKLLVPWSCLEAGTAGVAGWSLPSLQTFPWLCYSVDRVEFPAWQGSIVTLS